MNLQCLCLCLIRVYRWEPLNTILPIFDLISLETKVAAHRAVSIFHSKRMAPIVSVSQTWKFLRKNIHRIRPVTAHVIRIARKAPVCISQQIVHTSFRFPAIVQMQKKPKGIDLHLIR